MDDSIHATPIAGESSATHWDLENILHGAVGQNEFVPYYQPVFSLYTGQVTRVAVSLWWQHPQLGLLPPNKFLAVAEETDLILKIGGWLLHEACSQAQKWFSLGYQFSCIGVDVATRQFHHQNLVDLIQKVLAATGLPATALELEIMERANCRDINPNVLQDLQELGVRLSIDGFSMDSSLRCLEWFPLSTLKIDQSFVRGMNENGRYGAIVSAVIAMAHNLKLKVVAVGVETQEQINWLRQYGCDEIQGEVVCPPVTASVLTRLFQERGAFWLTAHQISRDKFAPLIHYQATQSIGYALVDESLQIVLANECFKSWSDKQIRNITGLLLTEVFPELVGTEQNLVNLLHHSQKVIALSQIYRPSADEFGRYFDLRIEPFMAASSHLLVVVSDVTEQTHLEFSLRQERNELRLMMGNLRK